MARLNISSSKVRIAFALMLPHHVENQAQQLVGINFTGTIDVRFREEVPGLKSEKHKGFSQV